MNPSFRPPRSDAQTRTPSRYWLGVARWSLSILLGFELVIRVDWYFFPAAFYTVVVLVGGYVLRARRIDLAHLDLEQSYFLPLIAAQYLFAFLFAAGGASPFIYFQF